MKSTTAITVIPSTDGFIDSFVPGAGAVIADRLANAVGLGSNHSKRAYLSYGWWGDIARENQAALPTSHCHIPKTAAQAATKWAPTATPF
jgi:hypothetical protein